MKNMSKFMQTLLLGGILLVGISLSEAIDEKPGKPVHRSLENNRRSEVSEKDEKLKTASQSLFGYNNNGFQNGFNNGFNSNGFSTGVNGGVYPQGNYASSGLYNGVNNFNQNGLTNYPFGYNGNNVNGFGFQGQGVYPGVQGSYANQGFQQGGFNTLGGVGNGRYPPFNGFGSPFNSQLGPIGVGGNFQTAGYPNPNGLYQGGQITDRRANQYIGNGVTIGNKIDVGGDGRSSGVSSSSSRTGRTNQPGFVAGQGFGLNYADQQGYNILPGGVFNANNGLGYPGVYSRQNPNIYNQQFDYNRFPNSGANRFYDGANSERSFQQRIHRFVGPDTGRRN